MEHGFVTRVLHYSDGRQIIEVRGQDTDALYTSARDRYDREWSEGDIVAIYQTTLMPEALASHVGYRNVLTICFLPPDMDALEADDRVPRSV